MQRSTLQTLFVVTLVAAATVALSGAAAAASDANITASPDTGTATSTHNVTVTVDEAEAGNFTNVTVDYGGTGVDVSNVSHSGIVAGIDRGGDADGTATDADVTGNVTAVRKGPAAETLTIAFSGATAVEAGDEVVLTLPGVENPEQGEYDVAVRVNGGSNATATLSITEATPTPSPTESPSPTSDDPGGNGTDTDGQVGFGLVAALVALVGVTALAGRSLDG